mgnify:CR=1 FL=1
MTLPSNSSLVVISSKYRLDKKNQSTSNFEINLNQPLWCFGYSIKNISIPNTQYNINLKNNDFQIETGGVIFSYTVPVGQYTTTELITVLEQEFPTLTITQDPLTKKITIDTGASSLVVPETEIISGFGILGYTYYQVLSGVITADHLVKLNGVYNAYIISSDLTQNNANQGLMRDGARVDLVSEVSITSPFGVYTNISETSYGLNTTLFDKGSNIQKIGIKVVDLDQNVLNLQGLDVEIVLKVYQERNDDK